MQMRSGTLAGGTDVGNGLPPAHLLSGLYHHRGTVSVEGFQPLAVIDNDRIAVTGKHPGSPGTGTVDRIHRSAVGGDDRFAKDVVPGNVNSLMHRSPTRTVGGGNGGIPRKRPGKVSGDNAVAEDPALADEGRAWFKRIEDGDPEALEIFNWFKSVTLKDAERVYDMLGVKFDSYAGESFYNDKMQPVIDELREKGLLIEDKGAQIVDLQEWGMPPALILRSDGATLYITRDLAAAKYRKDTYNFDKCIYVTSAGQSLHFAQWFKVVELMGYDWHDKLVHVPYGTVSINGAKLATRTGNVILLKDLFKEAIARVYEISKEKNPDEAECMAIAEKVGVGAVVFYYLSNNRMRDINFMMEDALSFDGNTGPYAQYTYARTCSVLEKVGRDGTMTDAPLTEPEVSLAKTLARFPEKINQAIADYEPSNVTRYILDLCAAFNHFYHECSIANCESESLKSSRIALTRATNQVLRTALHLICLQTPEKI